MYDSAQRTTLAPSAHKPAEGEIETLFSALRALPSRGESARQLRARIAHFHQPVVVREAARYRNRGVDVGELRQIASIGLMKALAGFSPGPDRRFFSYLLTTVSGVIKRHFRDNLWAVHVPRAHRDRRGELNRYVADFTQEHARAPTLAEVGAHFGTDPTATGELVNGAAAYSALSLDSPTRADEEGGEEFLGNSIGGLDHELELVVDRLVLRSALIRLPEPQRTVVLLSFFEERPQTHIADRLGCSQMQVSRLLRSALATLRTELLAVD